MRLNNKAAIVTGAASGIGTATARAFAREGAHVLLVDRDQKRGEQVTAQIASQGTRAFFLKADVGEIASIDAMVDTAMAHFGRIDILHNNTAGSATGPLGDITLEQWETSMRLGLRPYWYASRQVLPHMIAGGGGAIVNTGSISGLRADLRLGTYNAVKAAIVNLSRSLALDYAKQNIRCNAVCPGITFTAPFEVMQRTHPEALARMAQSVPLKRFGRPEEIANVIAFLASDEASFVTGAAITVDGGQSAWTASPSFQDSLS